ncbi:hypothetical protein NLI96_g5964 [Meripilus lineatus]|uniref:F-box domain-containing protein n=1 Tax=Meripilus lineatus TaxID=2056292 RepID=A0AAD5V768_9APHY|nr:hypothetical protein NLI96_g5964 [Physisporinus lineatus]
MVHRHQNTLPLTLPFDIWEHIGGFLRDDMDSLSACTLTSPDWREACLKYLYTTILLNPCRAEGCGLLKCKPVVARWVNLLVFKNVTRRRSAPVIHWVEDACSRLQGQRLALCKLSSIGFEGVDEESFANALYPITEGSPLRKITFTSCTLDPRILADIAKPKYMSQLRELVVTHCSCASLPPQNKWLISLNT